MFPSKLGDDGLPDGWEIGRLDDWATSSPNTVKPDEIPADTNYIGLEHMPRRSIALGEWETAAKVTSNKSRFSEGQVLFGKLRSYFHKVGIAPISGICSTDIVVVDGLSRQLVPFVATLMSTDEFVAYTDQSSTGTKMPRTSWKTMRDYRVPRAPKEVVGAFGFLVQPIHEKIMHSLIENRTLAEMRDLLLPKLMSGEIRLKDAEGLEPIEKAPPASTFATDLLGEPSLTPEQEEERNAVIVAATVRALQEGDLLVGNVRVMKGTYLLKRKLELSVAEFERQAAGPYDRALNHETRSYARDRSWIRETSRKNANGERILGNRPASKCSEIDPLIDHYGLREAVDWLSEHFKGASRDWMECVATVDVALQELTRKRLDTTIENIKFDIASDPEWKPKL
ncbi:hypothetical protein N9K16_05600, partial [Alphaproteobacteria bacterium]|nr:hypothetical protein [Alphaproteobacteria bacterium]